MNAMKKVVEKSLPIRPAGSTMRELTLIKNLMAADFAQKHSPQMETA